MAVEHFLLVALQNLSRAFSLVARTDPRTDPGKEDSILTIAERDTHQSSA